jgi:arabinan endo-1,5-alpha-L-arabinosidase
MPRTRIVIALVVAAALIGGCSKASAASPSPSASETVGVVESADDKEIPKETELAKIEPALPAETAQPSAPVTAPGAGFDFQDGPKPTFSNVSVHDPSVFKANNYYYIIGSHLAVAKSSDLMKWQQLTIGWQDGGNPFYPVDNPDPSVQTMEEQIKDVERGKENELGFFAADIQAMEDGRFFHYYCLTASWKSSAIGLAIAENPEGPYVTQGLIVRSAMAGENRAPDGVAVWTEKLYPNCIDPQAFYDNEGNFWLVYGSWSGGIFLLELDPGTGLLKEGSEINGESHGYGRALIENSHSAIEGPYILYVPETQYYYLFVSYGGLDSAGGYNIRVFRSRSVTGPYSDSKSELRHRLDRVNFNSAGVKLMGGYQFKHLENEPGRTTLTLSPGHNSAIRDENGRLFLIFHQRFAGGEAHQVRVHEMFATSDGWLAVSPFRYDGADVKTFKEEELAGTWKVIDHEHDVNTKAHISKTVQFLLDGQIKGELEGSWSLGEDGTSALIALDGMEYSGVFLRRWDSDNLMWVQALTAISGEGTALWGAGAALK